LRLGVDISFWQRMRRFWQRMRRKPGI